MNHSPLMNVSPVDGRYYDKTNGLAPYFSEFALIKYRVQVEIEYFIYLYEMGLGELSDLDKTQVESLREVYKEFSPENAQAIKDIERVTNHDVKAVEYFIKEEFDKRGLEAKKEFIHFGLTSQDVNNTAIPLSIKEWLDEYFVPEMNQVLADITDKAEAWAHIPLLARTHGQPASPTMLGKEIQVFVVRLQEQLDYLKEVKMAAKFGGATGNMNAHYVAYPDIDWHGHANTFVEQKLGLYRSYPTTQIEHYDHLAALFNALERVNTILVDFSRDIWQYVAMDYFKQKIKKGEVGSSAMPHKVNPIDFENAEGNLQLANAILHHLAQKLPISRLQRDLTDSTVLRNVGVPFGHMTIAFKSIRKGMGKLIENEEKIRADLDNNVMVLAEAIQTVLRKESYPEPYEALKALTRTNTKVTMETISSFIETLEVSDELKGYLQTLTPANYTGKVQ